VLDPALPGIENARGWFGAWVDDLYNDPEVHTPWGDFDTITLDFEIELHNVDLRVERTTPYLSQIVGHRGYRKPEDAHLIRLGVLTARRGWVEAPSVINTWPLRKLTAWLQARRQKKAKS